MIVSGIDSDFRATVVHTPVLLGLGIWFLYDVLGWSAFVGLAAMILLFPVPGYVAKIIQKVQKERMKKVRAYLSSPYLLYVADQWCRRMLGLSQLQKVSNDQTTNALRELD